MTDITTLIDLITRGGLVTALIIALVGGMKGWYVWKGGHEEAIRNLEKALKDHREESEGRLDDVTRDRNYWRDQAIRCLSATGRITDVLEATKNNK